MQGQANGGRIMQPTTTTEPPVAEATPPEKRGIAPVWHTLVFIAIFAGLSVGGRVRAEEVTLKGQAHWPLYVETIVMQWVLILYVCWGLWLRKRKLRDVIGGRWDTAGAFFLDLAIAAGFFVANVVVRAVILGALLAVNKGLRTVATQGVQNVAKAIGPQNRWELLLFMGVALTAAICEEIMFRGYLQQQLASWTRNLSLGVVLSAIVFCVGHAYQGWFLALQVGVLGLMLGILAAWRKSLRPGMLAHGLQDVISGTLSFFAKSLFSHLH